MKIIVFKDGHAIVIFLFLMRDHKSKITMLHSQIVQQSTKFTKC